MIDQTMLDHSWIRQTVIGMDAQRDLIQFIPVFLVEREGLAGFRKVLKQCFRLTMHVCNASLLWKVTVARASVKAISHRGGEVLPHWMGYMLGAAWREIRRAEPSSAHQRKKTVPSSFLLRLRTFTIRCQVRWRSRFQFRYLHRFPPFTGKVFVLLMFKARDRLMGRMHRQINRAAVSKYPGRHWLAEIIVRCPNFTLVTLTVTKRRA